MQTTTNPEIPSWQTAYTLGGHFHNQTNYSEEARAHRVTDTTPSQKRDFNQSIDHEILTIEANEEMRFGSIPDLRYFCHALYSTFFENRVSFDAIQFLPIFESINKIKPTALSRFLTNPKTNHVLVNNKYLKVVLPLAILLMYRP